MKHVQRVKLAGHALYRVLYLLILAGLILAMPEYSLHAQSSEKKLDPATEAAYRRLTAAIDPAALDRHVRALSAIPSRVAGYPGSRQAAEYVEQQFRKAGLTNVATEQFEVTVPVSDGLRIKDSVLLVDILTRDDASPLVRHILSRLTPETLQKLNECVPPLREFQQTDEVLQRENAAYQEQLEAHPTAPGTLPLVKPNSLVTAEHNHQEAQAALREKLAALEPYLIDELNWLCYNGPLYTPERFAGVTLSAETRQLLANPSKGGGLLTLNRHLLADAFPDFQGENVTRLV
ncbi:MAG TPA: hypothetical protein PLZ94_19810, partial [Armatimonadota bacterium]|nr:hypothetical protein [Armatimonadota bacterium]